MTEQFLRGSVWVMPRVSELDRAVQDFLKEGLQDVEPDIEFNDQKIKLIAVTQTGTGVVRYCVTKGMPPDVIPGELLPDVRAEIKKEKKLKAQKLKNKQSKDTPTAPKDTPTQPLTQPQDTSTPPLTQPEDTPTEPYVEGEPSSKRPRYSFGVEKQENGEFTLGGTNIVLEGAGP